MVIPEFSFAQTPKVIFGIDAFKHLPECIERYGQRIIVVLGSRSFQTSYQWPWLTQTLKALNIKFHVITVGHEPSPDSIDSTVRHFAQNKIDAVVAIGGGSVIDTGKAISAMLPVQEPVREFLEGVGTRKHPGLKLPFIAVPTTSGTGTEATKNAVLSDVGETGYKKSLRHDHFVPNIALIDPQLSLSCPTHITAQCGMDALAQLLESFFSSRSSLLTDTLALQGLEVVTGSLLPAFHEPANSEARSGMAFAAFLSGVTLANAGLGVVHCLSSVIGGYFSVPHGVICGTLLAEGMRINIEKLKNQGQDGRSMLKKHAQAGALLAKRPLTNTEEGCAWLVDTLKIWTKELKLPALSTYGITLEHIDKIVAETTNRNNPVPLEPYDIKTILLANLSLA